jgi:hypothetical protein
VKLKTTLSILGGLPVEIEYEIEKDFDDTGAILELCDEWHITEIGGVKCKSPPMWLYRRIAEKGGEYERIESYLMSAYDAWQKDKAQNE